MLKNMRILIIGGKIINLQKAKALGLEILYIQKQEYIQEKELLLDSLLNHADHVFFLDYENPEVLLPLVKTLYEIFAFQYVISPTEPGFLPAAQINDFLGLTGNSLDTARLLKNKWDMRQRLNFLGVSPVAAQIGQTEVDLFTFAKNYGLPMIVKPVDGTASLGIFCIKKDAEINSTWQQIQKLNLSSFIMEEYLDGSEVSVEALTFNGQHVVVCITDKLTLPNFVESGHSVPTQLDDVSQAQVIDTVITFLNAVGLKEGPSHTEVKLTANGPRIVESHNRVGGDKIVDLVEIVYGIDMVSLSFAWLFGLAKPLSGSLKPQGGAAIRFFAPPPGIVQKISGVEKIQNREEVVEIELTVKIGSQIQPVLKSQDRSGYLIVKGTSAQDAISTCEKLMQEVCIVISGVK
mgnify:CR=1 FL=1